MTEDIAHRLAISEVLDQRIHQLETWSTEHDDAHTDADWQMLIKIYADAGLPIKVAALAIAWQEAKYRQRIEKPKTIAPSSWKLGEPAYVYGLVDGGPKVQKVGASKCPTCGEEYIGKSYECAAC